MCPLQGPWPATQACALTGNRSSDLLVHRLVALNKLSHTSQGRACFSKLSRRQVRYKELYLKGLLKQRDSIYVAIPKRGVEGGWSLDRSLQQKL